MLPTRKPPLSIRSAVLGVVLAVLALVTPFGSAAADDLTGHDVTFRSGDTTLHGTVLTPTGAGADRAGVVLVAGSGDGPRDRYRAEAEALARSGMVVLIYDKRADYSRATSSFATLADDAVAGVDLVASRPDVDPSRVGLWGHSEGGWVAPLAASRSADVGFVITVGASGLPADRTQIWSNRTHLVHAGVTESLHDPIGVNLSRMLVAAGLFGDVGNDPVSALERMDQPVLAVFGAQDRSTAPGEGVQVYRRALDDGGNTAYTIRVVEGADHALRRSGDGFGARSGEFAPGYVDLMARWVDDLAAGPPRASADQPPAQALTSTPTRPLAWYESVGLQLAVFGLLLVAFLGHPVGGAVRRLRRRGPVPTPWAARVLAGAGAATVVGTAAYLFRTVSTGATEIGPTVLGRPPLWLALQVLAVGVLAATVLVARGWWRGGRRSPRLGALAVGGVVFVPWAAYWGLLTV